MLNWIPAPEAELWGAACRLSNAKVHCLCTVKLGPIRRKTYFQKQDLEPEVGTTDAFQTLTLEQKKIRPHPGIDTSNSVSLSENHRNLWRSAFCFILFRLIPNSILIAGILRLHDEFVHRFFRCSLWLTRKPRVPSALTGAPPCHGWPFGSIYPWECFRPKFTNCSFAHKSFTEM